MYGYAFSLEWTYIIRFIYKEEKLPVPLGKVKYHVPWWLTPLPCHMAAQEEHAQPHYDPSPNATLGLPPCI